MGRIERRRFHALCGAGSRSLLKAGAGGAAEPEVLRLSPDGWAPNNERLPVIVCRGAITAMGADPAGLSETALERNGWPPLWRNGIDDFHHCHSAAHEAPGFACGRARLMRGGEKGSGVFVRAGDAAALPAATGHCRMESSTDFLVAGAYPAGRRVAMLRRAPPPAEIAVMLQLWFPASDPV